MIGFWFSFAAAVLTTVSFVPQAMLVLKTGKTEGISLTMYAMFTVGVACWLIYGIILNSWPMIVANIVTLGLASLILSLKIRHTIRERKNLR